MNFCDENFAMNRLSANKNLSEKDFLERKNKAVFKQHVRAVREKALEEFDDDDLDDELDDGFIHFEPAEDYKI